MRRPVVAFGLSFALYFLVTIALTWPLALHPASRVPNDLGDSLLNVFLMAWNAREVPLTASWWNLPQYYPAFGVTAFSEHLLGLAIITTPVILVTGNPLLAYNAAFFLSFPLCALAAHLLAFELTRRHDVGVLVALAFAFAPYRMSQFAHVQVLSSYWIPLALFALHRFLREPRWRWAALFAGAWLMQALANGYYLFYFSVLAGLWVLWFALGRMAWRDLLRLITAWSAAALAMLPVALGYLTYQRAYGLKRGPDEIEAFSADVASLLSAAGDLRVWGWLQVIDRPESRLFPGLTLVLLLATGVAVAWMAASSGATRPRATRILVGGATLAALVAATPLWFGPWKLELGNLRLLSVGSPEKPLSIAVLLCLVALALRPSVRAGWRRRSPLAFYTLAAGVMWIFSLGPAPTLMNEPVMYKAPYAWLLSLPGVDGVRVPSRFWTLATACMAAAAGLAFVRLERRWRVVRGALPVVALLMLAESWPAPLKLEMPPAPRPAYARAVARLELPSTKDRDLQALYRAAAHERPLVNGYSGYFAPHYDALMRLLDERDPRALSHLSAFGPLEVVVDHEQDLDGGWRAYVGGHPQAEVVHEERAYSVYLVRRGSSRIALPELSGVPLHLAGVRATPGQDLVPNLTDGDRITRWHTGGPQGPGAELLLDLGGVREVQGVELQLGGYVADFPRELVIELSEDGAAWTPAWSGPTAFVAYLAGLEDPLLMPLRFAIGPAPARFVRLRQTANDPVYYWTIAELRLFGAAASPGAGASHP
jgi:hypothetical protein